MHKPNQIIFLAIPILLAASCGVGPEDPPPGGVDSTADPIWGGQTDSTDTAVGAIVIGAGTTGWQPWCTGTLIAPNVVLTANHCIAANLHFCTAQNLSSCTGASGNSVDVESAWGGPWGLIPAGWQSVGPYDVALLHLAKPIYTIAPKVIRTTGIPLGQSATQIGYGNGGTGRKSASVTLSTGWNFDGTVDVGYGNGGGCAGDSGGPIIWGGEIVGVTSGEYLSAPNAPSLCPTWTSRTIMAPLSASTVQWITDQAADWATDPMFSVVSWGTNRLDSFGRSNTGTVQQMSWNGSGWAGSSIAAPSGGFVGTPEAVSRSLNHLDLFVIGTNGHFFQNQCNSSSGCTTSGWSGWVDRGTGFGFSHLTAVSWGPDRIDVFGLSTQGLMLHNFCTGTCATGTWGSWENLLGGFFGQIKAATWGPNRIDIFGVGTDGNLYHKSGTGAPNQWTPSIANGWEFFGGPVKSQYSVVRGVEPSRLDVVLKSADNGVYWGVLKAATGWTGLFPLGGVVLGGVSAVSWGPNRLDVFVQGTDTSLFHQALAGGAWSGWEGLGGSISGTPAAVSWSSGRLDIFALTAAQYFTHISFQNVWDNFGGPTAIYTW